ncbi:hypothetical protein V7S43_013789 [Phytophthora oleae]|uniref:Uncharacterized protein n=1 Tax=Phytophthora oleae TaxID=2107226 RepID=A0ABD3F3X5_9STRA
MICYRAQHGDTVAPEPSTEEQPSALDDASGVIQDAGNDTTLEEPAREFAPASNSQQRIDELPNVSANSPRQAARSLTGVLGAIDVVNDNVATEIAEIQQPVDSDDLNSDVDGDMDSDNWYAETEATAARTEESESGAQPALLQDDDERADETRRVMKNWRQLEKARIAAVKARLSRDWSTTTDNWDNLTTDEMEALAHDVERLKKLRTDGWNYATHPEQTTPYPGLYAGEHGPTPEVLCMAL